MDKKTKTEDSKSTYKERDPKEKKLEMMGDETTRTAGDRSESEVEGGKDVRSIDAQGQDERQKRDNDDRNSLEEKDPMEVKFNTAKWFFQTSWRQLPENPSEKRFMRPTCKVQIPKSLSSAFFPFP